MKIELMEEQLFQFQNVNDLSVCYEKDEDPRKKKLEDTAVKKAEEGIGKVSEASKQKKSWKDSVKANDEGDP